LKECCHENVSSVEAQNHLANCWITPARANQITRGRPVAFIVSNEAYRIGRPSGIRANLGLSGCDCCVWGSGKKGATDALLADRKADTQRSMTLICWIPRIADVAR